MMRNILFDFENIRVFVDDIIVFTKTLADIITVLEKLFAVLHEFNITINFNKCIFLRENVKYLGMEITKTGIKVDQ